jgi:hypothetical protein
VTSGDSPALLLGTHTFAAAGDAARRQAAALASLRALGGVRLANVQFATGGHEAPGLDTLAVLERDSNTVTGRPGPRKPIVSDIFDALAREARRQGTAYFAFANADIQISQDAVDRIGAGGHDAFIFSREDFDGASHLPLGMVIAGVDAFAVSTAWWEAHRRRFRPYIAGEPTWDNVYASILLCHAGASFENRRALIRHEAHATVWHPHGPFGDYTRLLAAHDAGYFSLWCRYWDRLQHLRASGAPETHERALRQEIFVWNRSFRQRGTQAARSIKARVRYHFARRQS